MYYYSFINSGGFNDEYKIVKLSEFQSKAKHVYPYE